MESEQQWTDITERDSVDQHGSSNVQASERDAAESLVINARQESSYEYI